jgi:hypothetical protein
VYQRRDTAELLPASGIPPLTPVPFLGEESVLNMCADSRPHRLFISMKHHLLDDNPFALKLSSMPNDDNYIKEKFCDSGNRDLIHFLSKALGGDKNNRDNLKAIRAFPRRVLTGTDKAKSIPTPINSFSVFYGYRDL